MSPGVEWTIMQSPGTLLHRGRIGAVPLARRETADALRNGAVPSGRGPAVSGRYLAAGYELR